MFLRLVARPLMAKVKQTTGIKKVPEDAVPNAREVLIGLYSQLLNEFKKLPEDLKFHKYLQEHANFMLKNFQEDEDVTSIPSRLFTSHSQIEALIKETRRGLEEISEWNSRPVGPLSDVTWFGKPNERAMLLQLYNDALNVLRTVPRKHQLKSFAESSITRKLKICQEEDDWESIKSKLNCEDPIQRARYELQYWRLNSASDTRPIRQSYAPALPEVFKPSSDDKFNIWISKVISCLSGKDTLAVSSSESPFKP